MPTKTSTPRQAMAFIVTPTAPRRNYRTPPGEGTRRKSLIQTASDFGTADAWQMFQGDDKHCGPLPLASPGPAPEPGYLRGVRGVLRASPGDVPVVWQRRVRAAPAPARGADPQPDGSQLMRARWSVVAVASLWLGALLVPSAWAGEPADQLFANIDRVLKLLDDP